MDTANWPAAHQALRDPASLKPHPRNSRLHTPEQVEQVANSMREWGFTMPVLVTEDGTIVAGHCRVMAAKQLGLKEVPTITAVGWSEAQVRAYIIADNRLTELGTWAPEVLREEAIYLTEAEFNTGLLGFDEPDLNKLVADEPLPTFRGTALFADAPAEATGGYASGSAVNGYDRSAFDANAHTDGALFTKFGVPPFSVLDTRRDYWVQRRKVWLDVIGGSLTDTKEGVLGNQLMAWINNGSSNFDPVLAEAIMRWFCPEGGSVIDPFGGEQTKGVVAGVLGLKYRAVEIRQEQVDVNMAATTRYPNVRYTCGSSVNIHKLVRDRKFNLCFTSPPYYDLEVYSKEDMSALGTYEEFMALYEEIFRRCVGMLDDNAFLVVKIGEIRNKKTGIYRNFVGDNISMFLRLGLHYYNELVLLNAEGSAPQRAGRSMNNRKLPKVHQNVLVFVKGDWKKACEACGPVPEDVLAEAAGDA